MSELEKNLNPEENFEQNKDVQNEETVNEQQLENNLEPSNEESLSAAEKILKKLSKDKKVEKTEEKVEEVFSHNEAVIEEDDENEDPDNLESLTEHEDIEEVKQKYQLLSRPDLIAAYKELISSEDEESIRAHLETIKNFFYKQRNEEYNAAKEEFINNGGIEEEFQFEDKYEQEFKDIQFVFKEKRRQKLEELEKVKEQNYHKKIQVIEELKNLVNGTESLNDTFGNFRDIQHRWNEIGQVPQSRVKSLWETYHHHVQSFYDYVKINKELRDLDLRKNLEVKIELCVLAEELIVEEKVVKAYKDLQSLHQQWREIGPVPNENKDEIWDRFKDASAKINKRHQDYFESLKDEQLNNLKAKVMICEEAEKLSEIELKTPKDWDETSKELIKLQDLWRAIGFAPKKDNNRIYNRFRRACDVFFNKKRDFFAQHRQLQNQNLEQKTELCMQAEAMQESTDWKKTTEELIGLQKKWRKIGPVPRKYSDEIWQRFRAACNRFFERKEAHYNDIEKEQDDNLKQKVELISKLENLLNAESSQGDLHAHVQEIQNEWSKIGFVPRDSKNDIAEKYKVLINKFYGSIQMSDSKRQSGQYKSKLDDIGNNPKSKEKLKLEREKIAGKIQKLRSDISVWENNIGFFAQSKNAESMIKNIQQKIEEARKSVDELMDQLKMIDEMRKS
jgi:hypothetical protein